MWTVVETDSVYVGILKARIVLWGWLGCNQSGRPAKSYYAFYQLGRLEWSGAPGGREEGGEGAGEQGGTHYQAHLQHHL